MYIASYILIAQYEHIILCCIMVNGLKFILQFFTKNSNIASLLKFES